MDIKALSDEEFARRGNALFEKNVRPHVDVESDAHLFVAIDIATGAYAVDVDAAIATDKLIDQQPDAQGRIWYRRVGSEHAYRMGWRGSEM
jgi:hypothetical protein